MSIDQRKPAEGAKDPGQRPDPPTKPARGKRKKRSRLDRVLSAAFLVSLLFVAFLAGALVTEFKLGAYTMFLERPFRGVRAYWDKEVVRRGVRWPYDWWRVARESKRGVGTYREGEAYDGLTLYSSGGDSCSATLVSMSGDVVHRWHLPFSEVWPRAGHLADPVGDERICFRRTHLYPNGDLLAIYATSGDTPWGYGLAKIDKDSKLVWKFSQCVHHDLDVTSDGRIYTLTHEIRHAPLEGFPHLKTPILEDFVVELTEEGRFLRRVSVYEAFAKSPHAHVLLSTEANDRGDHLHVNAVARVSAAFAEKHSFAEVGQVLISMRHNETIAILDLESGQIVWARQGVWRMQHDPDPLDNGNILLFDNLGRYAEGGRSRVIEWNPANEKLEWVYEGSEAKPFDSMDRSCQQVLPGGNLLITESANGRILEVTRDKELVWEYFNPDRGGENGELVAVICSAHRFGRDELTFLDSEDAPSSAAAGR